VLNPNYANLRVWENVANSLQRPASLGETANEPRPAVRRQLHLSHSIDSDPVGTTASPTANGFAGDGYMIDQTLPQLDRGNSTYDIRHRLTFNFVWEMPFLRKA
jgi:hypothetical protein